MLTHLTSEQLALARFIDPNFAQLVKQTEAGIQEAREEPDADSALIDLLSKLIGRIKKESGAPEFSVLGLFSAQMRARVQDELDISQGETSALDGGKDGS